jgi:tripartite-type tricarboxylate transporter receptor subunit TctC
VHLRKLLVSVIAAALTTVVFSGSASADLNKPGDYAKRPITIIVCYGKGGGSDQAVAAMQGPLSKLIGVKINKINKPGGGGVNCLPDFQQTPADGYTILQHGDGMASKYVSGDMDLHPTKDLTPIAITNVAPTGIFVNPDDDRFVENGKASWDKVVAYAKANPKKLSVANINVAMELATMGKLEEFFGIETKQVMFDKPAQRYGAVIGGKLDILMEQPGDVIKHVQAGKLLPVLAIWPDRFAVFGDTKATGADYGMKWNPLLRIRSFWVKSDTPQPIKDYLNAAFSEAYKSDVHQAFLKRKALDIVNSYYGSKDMAKIFDEAIGTYAKVFKETGQRLRKDMQ